MLYFALSIKNETIDALLSKNSNLYLISFCLDKHRTADCSTSLSRNHNSGRSKFALPLENIAAPMSEPFVGDLPYAAAASAAMSYTCI
jgi:hypothetical protein